MPSASNRFAAQHGIKGVIGAERAKSYTASSYKGDQGGSASGFGLPHGAAGTSKKGVEIPGSGVYQGAPLHFQGGDAGGGVSVTQTLPTQKLYPKKEGYDERASGKAFGTVHGVPGVEGLSDPVPSGHSCPHGCGATSKSPHGLARHVHSKHGGFKGLGKAIVHGDSYKKTPEFRGETDDSAALKAISSEYAKAKSAIGSSDKLRAQTLSSYTVGDRCGNYGK